MGSKGNGAPKGTILELFLAILCQVCHSPRFSKIMCTAHSSTWVDEASDELKRDGTRTGSTDFPKSAGFRITLGRTRSKPRQFDECRHRTDGVLVIHFVERT